MNGFWNGHGFPRPVFIFITIAIASPVSSVPNVDGEQMRKKFILTHLISQKCCGLNMHLSD